MIEVSNEVDIPASPHQVWNALVDFAGYRFWNPYVAIRGVAGSGSEIEWSLGSTVLKRRIWVKAQISEFDEPSVLKWSFGSRAVVVITECFFLQATETGTRLQHKTTCRGMLMIFGKGLMRKRIEMIMAAEDKGLCRYFEAKARPPKQPARPIDKAHPQRRKSGRRTRRRPK